MPTRQAAFENVATLISFRVGHSDAEVLKKEFGLAYAAQQFVDLDQYEVLIKILNESLPTEPFLGKSLPQIENHLSRRAKLIQHSRHRFSTQSATIEEKRERWIKRLET